MSDYDSEVLSILLTSQMCELTQRPCQGERQGDTLQMVVYLATLDLTVL